MAEQYRLWKRNVNMQIELRFHHLSYRGLSTRAIIVYSLIELVVLIALVLGYVYRGELGFGPPQVELKEVYQPKQDGVVFDHSVFDSLLKKYVSADGLVDYVGLKGQESDLDGYMSALGSASFDELGRNEKLALLINAYNAFTLRLILDHYPLKSIKDIAKKDRWEAVRWDIAGHLYSLNQIEHEEIRPKFDEPRIHFALVCAAVSCPKLRNEAYTGAKLEEQLEDQAKYAMMHAKWFSFDREKRIARLTMLLKWYGSDFDQSKYGSALGFAAHYVGDFKKARDDGKLIEIEWIKYDWALNSQ